MYSKYRQKRNILCTNMIQDKIKSNIKAAAIF